jgi:glycosyltransferase involved in cell wall biosynthesis
MRSSTVGGDAAAAGTINLVSKIMSTVSGVGEARSGARRPLRVCHLAYTFYEYDNRVIRYAEEMASRGNEVDVIGLRIAGQPWRPITMTLNGVRSHRIQRRTSNEQKAWVYLLKIAWFFIKAATLLTLSPLRRRYDVIHVHNIPDFLVFAAVVPKLFGTRVILDIHDVVPELYVGKFPTTDRSFVFRAMLWIEGMACRFADHVIIANHLWYDKLVARSVPAEKCTPILNYPDLRMFQPVSQEQKSRSGRFLILYPGSLNYHQGLDIAIKAFARVKDRMPDAEFHIYGEGPTLPSLIQQVKDSGLEGRVKFMAVLPLTEMASVMASANLGVVPKRAEGFGNEAFSTKTLEFMASGVPVIVSKTQVDSYYFDETVVRFFRSSDDADLARVLLEVYAERGHHDAWIHAAHELAIRFSWQERGADYRQIVDHLVPQLPQNLPVQQQ